MTVDTSAVLPVLQNEAERADFVALIEHEGEDAGADLDLFLRRASIKTVPFDEDQLSLARTAFRRFGNGRHSAGLNFGDCASYALAQWSGEPLLFKGTDFSATDVARVRE